MLGSAKAQALTWGPVSDGKRSIAVGCRCSEALTNAVKYAHGARTEVTVGYMHESLTIEVVDHGSGRRGMDTGSGRGLLGLSERVAVLGGEFSTSRLADGGFAVRVSIHCAHP